MARQKKDEPVIVSIAPGQLVYISNVPSILVSNPPAVHHAKLLSYTDGVMTFAFCVKRVQGMQYAAGDEVAVSYVELREHYIFYTKIISIREQNDEDSFSPYEMGGFIDGMYAHDVYMVELRATSQIIRNQRREYYRSKLGIDIYYKPIPEYEARRSDSKVKFASQDGVEEKKKAEEGYYETELGYAKLTTLDISAGGFKFLSADTFEIHSHFDCMIILEREALPVIAQVLACTSSRDHFEKYYVRCCYFELSDTLRDRIVKFIFNQERKIQKKMSSKI